MGVLCPPVTPYCCEHFSFLSVVGTYCIMAAESSTADTWHRENTEDCSTCWGVHNCVEKLI